MNEERFIEIETKVAYQEHTISELNDVIYQQQKQIDQLEIMVKSLVDRITDMSEAGPTGKPADEKPPHY